jgi:hypothetical protein
MSQPASHPDSLRATFEAIAEMTATASNYAALASDFATLNDARGLAYALRSASAAIIEAASLVEDVKPAPRPKTGEAA